MSEDDFTLGDEEQFYSGPVMPVEGPPGQQRPPNLRQGQTQQQPQQQPIYSQPAPKKGTDVLTLVSIIALVLLSVMLYFSLAGEQSNSTSLRESLLEANTSLIMLQGDLSAAVDNNSAIFASIAACTSDKDNYASSLSYCNYAKATADNALGNCTIDNSNLMASYTRVQSERDDLIVNQTVCRANSSSLYSNFTAMNNSNSSLYSNFTNCTVAYNQTNATLSNITAAYTQLQGNNTVLQALYNSLNASHNSTILNMGCWVCWSKGYSGSVWLQVTPTNVTSCSNITQGGWWQASC